MQGQYEVEPNRIKTRTRPHWQFRSVMKFSIFVHQKTFLTMQFIFQTTAKMLIYSLHTFSKTFIVQKHVWVLLIHTCSWKATYKNVSHNPLSVSVISLPLFLHTWVVRVSISSTKQQQQPGKVKFNVVKKNWTDSYFGIEPHIIDEDVIHDLIWLISDFIQKKRKLNYKLLKILVNMP